ncbi:hypothetical protein [Candidatus Halobonum tyrrellensis]|uniref:hypothetical protein n=1 Tax=Candidatus Halobonum tyrrellensis TaxID=1431545 RepID=UPI0012693AAC|nr:hypothetical protein [Candidatus Halobonum tyrrellensis]
MSSTTGVNVEPILDPVEEIERRGFSRYDVFRDWVDLMLAALQRDDDTYLETLGRYDRDGTHDRERGERVPDLFASAFSELMAARTRRGEMTIADPACGSGDCSFLPLAIRTRRRSASGRTQTSSVRRWPRSTSASSTSTGRWSGAIRSP